MDSHWIAMLVPDIPLLEKLARTAAVYAFLVFAFRAFGKRELGQLNQFDLVVLLLLSNTVQNAIIGHDDSLTGGLIGGLALFIVNLLVVRFLYGHPWLEHLVEGEPEELIRRGRILEHNLRRNLITQAELAAAARRQGVGSLVDVETCRLEAGGGLTFVQKESTVAEKHFEALTNRLDRIERLLADAR
jgi:uncharacterized membrane protein YcaP (DUF421 family)